MFSYSWLSCLSLFITSTKNIGEIFTRALQVRNRAVVFRQRPFLLGMVTGLYRFDVIVYNSANFKFGRKSPISSKREPNGSCDQAVVNDVFFRW
jgi:hypothetical protein